MRIFAFGVILLAGFLIGASLGPQLFGDGKKYTEEESIEAVTTKKLKWKMASAYASQTPVIGSVMLRTLEKIKISSGGNFEINYFEPGALVPALEIFDAVSSGGIDAGYATPGFWAGKVASLQLFASVPFGPASSEYMAWMYYGGGKELMDELYARHNIKSIPCILMPPEASGWFRKEIQSLEDLKGLKMRFFALGARVMEKLGVSTQLLAGGDIFPALELGTIDATEYSSPAVDESLGFYQVASHYYFPGWHQQSTWGDIIINLEKWNELPKENQILLETACGDAIRDSIAEGEALQIAAMEKLEDKGVIFHRWSNDILEAYENAWNEVALEESNNDPDFKRVYEELIEFRKRYNIWKSLGYLN